VCHGARRVEKQEEEQEQEQEQEEEEERVGECYWRRVRVCLQWWIDWQLCTRRLLS
jgi:hypothetical protein